MACFTATANRCKTRLCFHNSRFHSPLTTDKRTCLEHFGPRFCSSLKRKVHRGRLTRVYSRGLALSREPRGRYCNPVRATRIEVCSISAAGVRGHGNARGDRAPADRDRGATNPAAPALSHPPTHLP